jgi:hypothetical protein
VDEDGTFNMFKSNHPESVDPVWFQDLVRRAFEREMRRQQSENCFDVDEALERAMWYVFDLRNNLADLYKAGCVGEEGTGIGFC